MSHREVMQKALEFCEFLWRDVPLNDYSEDMRQDVEAALRAALAEPTCKDDLQVEPVQEPVGPCKYADQCNEDGLCTSGCENRDWLTAASASGYTLAQRLHWCAISWRDDAPALSALLNEARAALAKPTGKDDLQVEPVAKVELMTTGGNAGLATRIVEIDDHLRERLRPGQMLYTHPAPQRQPEVHPVTGEQLPTSTAGWLHYVTDRTSAAWQEGYERGLKREGRRQPLTDEEIVALLGDVRAQVTGHVFLSFARAVERAHGITGKQP